MKEYYSTPKTFTTNTNISELPDLLPKYTYELVFDDGSKYTFDNIRVVAGDSNHYYMDRSMYNVKVALRTNLSIDVFNKHIDSGAKIYIYKDKANKRLPIDYICEQCFDITEANNEICIAFKAIYVTIPGEMESQQKELLDAIDKLP